MYTHVRHFLNKKTTAQGTTAALVLLELNPNNSTLTLSRFNVYSGQNLSLAR